MTYNSHIVAGKTNAWALCAHQRWNY